MMSLRNSVLQQETDEGLGWVGLDTHWSLSLSSSSSGIEFPVEKRTIMVVHLLQYFLWKLRVYRVTHTHQPREIARAVSSTCLPRGQHQAAPCGTLCVVVCDSVRRIKTSCDKRVALRRSIPKYTVQVPGSLLVTSRFSTSMPTVSGQRCRAERLELPVCRP